METTPKQEAQQEQAADESTSVPAWMMDAATEIKCLVLDRVTIFDIAKIIKRRAPKETGKPALNLFREGRDEKVEGVLAEARHQCLKTSLQLLTDRVAKLEHHSHDALGLPCVRL